MENGNSISHYRLAQIRMYFYTLYFKAFDLSSLWLVETIDSGISTFHWTQVAAV